MADSTEQKLDRAQVKKAILALQAVLKSKAKEDKLLLDDSQHISILFTLWKVPKKAQTIRIPLPHAQRTETEEVCLFTKDEPNMTPDQTQRFYKRLLQERGVKYITEVIPFKILKTEYKPYEAKRRLLGNFNMFLSDSRIRRLLPSHLGKSFYERKREPLCVDMTSKNLASDVHRLVQGTMMKVTNKGCCCMARVGHSDMTTDELTENIEAAVETVKAKFYTKGPVIKLIHVKSQASVALPIYTSELASLTILEETAAQEAMKRKAADGKLMPKSKSVAVKKTGTAAEKAKKKKVEDREQEDEEEIPQLVPIEMPRKKPKLEKPLKKKQLEKAPKAAAAGKNSKKPKKKPATKPGKMDSKLKRKVPKVK